MNQFRSRAAQAASQFFNTTKELKLLGWGMSGFVFLSPDGTSAVKIHHYDHGFATELQAYRKLREFSITNLHGFSVPKPRNYRPELKAICMDCVVSPFLLDFAGAHFKFPDYSDDVWDHWRSEVEMRFGPNSHLAFAVYGSLQQYGIWYTDLRPSNLNLDGHPEAQPIPPDDSDDF